MSFLIVFFSVAAWHELLSIKFLTVLDDDSSLNREALSYVHLSLSCPLVRSYKWRQGIETCVELVVTIAAALSTIFMTAS